ncbi:MAG TPA: hypothetical protein VF813_05950 [Anaerolineaceae bacterium]
MKTLNSIGLIVLAVWLVLEGLVTLFKIDIPSLTLILPILAILAGVLVLLRIRDSKPIVNLGMLLLALWLILTGLIPLLRINQADLGLVMAVLGVAAGVLLLLGQ